MTLPNAPPIIIAAPILPRAANSSRKMARTNYALTATASTKKKYFCQPP